MRFLAALVLSFSLAQPGFAQSEERATQILTAWSDWAEAGGTTQSTIVVMQAGEIVSETGIGVAAETIMPIASLSKAITAECVSRLAASGVLSMDMMLGDVLDVPQTLQSVTLAQLLTHTSGIWPDSTQNNVALRNAQTDQTQSIAQRALRRDVQMADVGTIAYNNENYALLGAVIEKVTEETYEQACAGAVLEPLGIQSASLQGEWAAHGAWGGWSISASDYARFAWAMFGPTSQIGQSPADWPSTDLGNGAHYGMGVLWRAIDGRNVFWSSGMLCWNNSGDGGYFASYGGEWLIVTLYADCLAGTERLQDLDLALFEAAVR